MSLPTRYGGLITQTKKSESGYFLLTRCIRLTCLQIIHINYQQNKRRSSTKRIHTGRIFSKIEIKHKKKSRLEVSLALFHKRRKKHVILITQKKGRLIRRCFYFTTLLKKCQYGLRYYIEKVHVNQNVSQRNVVFMRCSYICLAIFHNFFNYKRILV